MAGIGSPSKNIGDSFTAGDAEEIERNGIKKNPEARSQKSEEKARKFIDAGFRLSIPEFRI
jgi:hypothetical protein